MTAGVGEGPTERCLQLYRSNISGVAGPSAQKKPVFAQKWAKNANFSAENSVFLAGVVSVRAPYPILRVPDPVKCVWNLSRNNLLGAARPSAQKKNSFCPKMAKNGQFLATNSVFLENNRVGGTPLSKFERAELRKKGFPWSFWVQNLFSWYFCAYTIGYRYAGLQHCSVAPPDNRQKYSKIGRVPGFLIV